MYGLYVDEDGEVVLGCGGRTLQSAATTQAVPLLPLGRPHRLKLLYKRPPVFSLSQDFFQSPLLGGHRLARAVDAAARAREESGLNFLSRHLATRVDTQLLQGRDDSGQENIFNGSCVVVRNGNIFHTRNDGILRASKVPEDSAETSLQLKWPLRCEDLKELDTFTENRLNHTRIYGISLLDTYEQLLLAARYEHGVCFARFSDENFQAVTSVPASCGAVDTRIISSQGAALLSADGNITMVDLARSSRECAAVTARYSLGEDFLLRKFKWGCLAAGPGPGVMAAAGRKTVGLIDSRTGRTVRLVHATGDKEYVRCLVSTESNQHQLCVSTDSGVRLWDYRAIRKDAKEAAAPPIVCLSTRFRRGSCLQTTKHIVHPDRPAVDWLLSLNQLGDISMAGLDWSHGQCTRGPPPLDDTVKRGCVVQSRRYPEFLGEPRLIGSWRDTVARARLAGNAWLEPAVERRCALPFRGLDAFCDSNHGHSRLHIVAINAEGDLFATSIHLQDSDSDLSADMPERGEPEDEEHNKMVNSRLEAWGRQVMESAQLKRIRARRIYRPPRLPTKEEFALEKGMEWAKTKSTRRKPPAVPRLEGEEPKRIRKNVKRKKEAMRQRLLRLMPIGMPHINMYNSQHQLKKGRVPHGLFLSDNARSRSVSSPRTGFIPGLPILDFARFGAGSRSQNIVKIMTPLGLEDGISRVSDREETSSRGEEEEEEHEEDTVGPPKETDESFALRSYLAELGMAEDLLLSQTFTTANFSQAFQDDDL